MTSVNNGNANSSIGGRGSGTGGSTSGIGGVGSTSGTSNTGNVGSTGNIGGVGNAGDVGGIGGTSSIGSVGDIGDVSGTSSADSTSGIGGVSGTSSTGSVGDIGGGTGGVGSTSSIGGTGGVGSTSSTGSTPKLRWGVLGCGVIANEMAQALKLQGRTIDAVANRTFEKAVSYAREHGIPKVYRTADELFADPDVDAVYITTPHNTHIFYLRLALAAGKHVVCEKAITLNSDELDEATALASANGVVLMDACTVLHMPLYKKLAQRMRADEFGRVNLVQENFGSFKDYDERNRFFNPDLAGGAMLDIGVYSLTLMRLFMESAPHERLSLMNPAPTGVDMTSGLLLRNEQGQLGVISLSLRSKQPKRAVISCDKAYIEIMEYPRADSATIVWTETGEVETVIVGERGKALCYVIGDLEAAVARTAKGVGGDQLARELTQMGVTSDVMRMMTDFRRDWGFYYPEEL